jgi:hypothetical protein
VIEHVSKTGSPLFQSIIGLVSKNAAMTELEFVKICYERVNQALNSLSLHRLLMGKSGEWGFARIGSPAIAWQPWPNEKARHNRQSSAGFSPSFGYAAGFSGLA